mgnify:CR=1 FL=1
MNDAYDVIICGGGPAGIGAAVAAGQASVKTLLVEMTGGLGGMMTNARIRSFCDSPGGWSRRASASGASTASR